MSRKAWLPRLAMVVVAIAAVSVIAAASPQGVRANGVVIIFFDNMENGVNGWTRDFEIDTTGGSGADCVPLEWHQNTGDAHSATHSWTNNPYTQAGIDGGICLNYLISPPILTPPGVPNLTLAYWEHYFTEGPDPRYGDPCNPPGNTPDCDYGLVQVSNDSGAIWDDISPQIEGGLPNDPSTQRILGIGPAVFTPGDTIQLRFRFNADALVASPPTGPFLGWFIDDVAVQYSPTAVDVASFRGTAGRRGVTLNWYAASETDTLGYNVWRFAGAKSVKVNRSLIAAKGLGAGGASYSLVDRLARPGASYTYKLQAVNKDGKRVWHASTNVRVWR